MITCHKRHLGHMALPWDVHGPADSTVAGFGPAADHVHARYRSPGNYK